MVTLSWLWGQRRPLSDTQKEVEVRNRQKVLWIPLAGSLLFLLLVLVAVLATASTLSFADTAPQSPAAVEGVDSWTWRGPSHLIAAGVAPMVKSLIIDPASPYTVYVGTNQGVYRSTNAGATWQPGNGGLGGYGDLVVSAIDIDLSNHQRLVIGTWGYGLFQSVDGGLNWSRLADPAVYADPQPSVALDPAALDPDAPQVRAGGPSDTDPSAAPDLQKLPLPAGEVLPQQQIAGAEQIESPQGLPAALSWTPVRDVAIHPSNPSQIFACVDNGYGLFVSNNSGGSWTSVSGVPVKSCRTFTFAPSNNLVRYVSFGTWDDSDGFFRTTNGGVSWQEVGVGEIAGTVVAVAIHPTNSNIVLAGTSNDALYRSDDGGASWTDVSTPSTLPDVDFFSVAFAPNNPNVAYAGGYYEVYRSGDAGITWGNADPAYPRDYVQGLAIHPTNSSTVLVGNNSFPFGGVYRRTSDGSAFALAATGMSDTFVLDIEQDPNDPNMLYAATWGGGVFRSDDGGQNWLHRFGVPYIYALEATQGPTGTVLYAATFYIDYGVLRSRTNGDTWTMVSLGWDSDISFDIKSLDGGSQNLIAATAHGVALSYDGGATWPPAAGLNQGLVLKLAQSPLDPNDWLAATYGGGVWSSGNGGASWSETRAGLGSQYVYDVAYSAPPYNTAYAATLGVSRSDNGGVSWYPSGLSGTYVRALDTLGGPGYDVFAGTHNRGVYMAPERSNWWFQMNEGLGELRVRSVFARDYDTLFAGTNGRGAWEYTIATRPRPVIHLPLVMRNYGIVFVPLVNGDFEQGPGVGWGEYADHGYEIILNDDYLPVDAHSGSWLTLLGSAWNNFSVIWQDATIPASDPWVRFYHWDASEDFCGNDYGYVFIDGTAVAYWNLCAENNTGGWVWSGVDLSAYAGQTVEVAIGASTNGSLNSNSFIDDVTLGYFGSPDLGVPEAPTVVDESTLLQMIQDLSPAQKPGSEPLFRPPEQPLNLPGLLDLSD